MSSYIPPTFIADLLAKVDIVEIIGNRVQLKKTGTNYAACCPFHDEKTPSFSVSQTKQFYYCFGCRASGNAIGFIMAFDHLDFIEAAETLAASLGLEVPREENANKQVSNTAPLYQLMEKASRHYQQQLKQSPEAIAYLKSRGLTGDICQQFGVGFAPDGWDNLLKHLARLPKQQPLLLQAGMLISKNNGGYYDRFRNRIMYPIRDRRGRVIGFGGRSLGEDTPKYLNSPETPIFHKGSELYGLYEARQNKQKPEQMLIVEGYMDVIALAQHEMRFAVATLGTATSSKHVQQVFRACNSIIFCFDGDRAGRQAAWRALEQTLPVMHDGLHAKFMFLPEGEDPDTMVRQHGKDHFIQLMSQAHPLSDFFFDQLKQQAGDETAAGKAHIAKLATTLIDKMPRGLYQQLLLEQLAERLNVQPEQLAGLITPKPSPQPPTRPFAKQENRSQTLPKPEKTALILLLQYPKLAESAEAKGRLSALPEKQTYLLSWVFQQLQQNSQLTAGALSELWRPHDPKVAKTLLELAATPHLTPEEGIEAEFLGALARLHEFYTAVKIQNLMDKAGSNTITREEKMLLNQLIAEKS